MNTTELKGNWNEQKAKLKKKFAVFKPNNLKKYSAWHPAKA